MAVCQDVLQRVQTVLNALVFGGYTNVAIAAAQQPRSDAGIGHLDVARRMEAEWTTLACRLIDDKPAPWKNIWWRHLRDVYGDALCGRDMLLGEWTFALFARARCGAILGAEDELSVVGPATLLPRAFG